MFAEELQASYNCILYDRLVHGELANNFVVVTGTDDEGRVDLRISVLEEYRFGEVSVGELLVVNYVAVIILDDEGEFFGSWVFELHFEDDVVIISTLVLYRNLFFSQGSFFAVDAAAICLAGGGANEDNY